MAVLGVDVGGTTTKLVRSDRDGIVSARSDLPSGDDPDDFGRRLVPALEALLDGTDVEAIGLSVAALIDDRRVIVQAPNLREFEGVDVARPLREWRPGVPIVVENDVNCAIVGEHRCGAGRGCDLLCMLSLGTGVGGGVIVGGRLVRGAHGLGGELGHMVLDHDGPLCTCGQRGHVEAFLSTQAMVQRARAAITADPTRAARLRERVEAGEVPEPRVLVECANSGCPVSRELLAESGRWLGIACTNLAHALQPDRILVGGGVSQAGDLILGPALEEFDRRCMRAVRGTVPVVLAALGVDGAALGAATLARDARLARS